MHGVDQDETLLDTTLPQALFHLRRNVDKRPPGPHLKPQLFSVTFHDKGFPFVLYGTLATRKQNMKKKSMPNIRAPEKI